MWRICNRFFGWQYITMMYAYDKEIFRVKIAPNGIKYIVAYGVIELEKDWKYWSPLTWIKEQKQ